MGLKWLITGGCGFIGRNLVQNLVEDGGHYLRIVDNLSVGNRSDLSQVCSFNEVSSGQFHFGHMESVVDLYIGDILSSELAIKLAEDIDIIVHLAANTGVGPSVENPRKDCEANVIGTLNYLEAARMNSVKRFVFASSGAPAGECEPPIHEELPPHPVSPYGASKLAGEGYCSAYYRTFGIETVCLRFGNVFGPLSGKKESVIAKFIKKALKKEPIEIYGDGNQTRDFIYIDDLVRAVKLSALNTGAKGEIFQIATSRETTINEVTQLIVSILDKKGYKSTQAVFSRPRKGDVLRNFSDTSKARNILGWEPKTNLPEGIAKTVDWFLQNPETINI